VLRITVTAATSASPDRVLALAGTDFSADRAKVWSISAVGYAFNHLAGRRGWAWYLRGALKAVEQAPDRSRRAATPEGPARATRRGETAGRAG
jgi:hypothetical protein